MKKYLYLMRVHHYIKNILIFMPLIFSGNLTDRRKFTATLLGMIAFSLVTSAVYIINDIRDAEKDRMHPTKKKMSPHNSAPALLKPLSRHLPLTPATTSVSVKRNPSH